MKRIGIVGSRRRNTQNDFLLIKKTFMNIYTTGDIIISGGCPKGADLFAEIIANEMNIPIKIYYPNWRNGRFAGIERNTLIAKDSDILIACVSNDRTGGTEDTIRKYRRFGKTNIIII